MQNSTTTVKLSVVTLHSGDNVPQLDSARNICLAAFDANGHFVNSGPATDHLDDADMQALCAMLIDASLDLLDIDNPTSGILYLHAASQHDIQAYYMPDGIVRYIDGPPSAAIH